MRSGALVLLVLAVLAGCNGEPAGTASSVEGEQPAGASGGPPPPPPAGHRWQGAGDVVLAVPVRWSTTTVDCGAAPPGGVAVLTGPQSLICYALAPSTTYLTIRSLGSTAAVDGAATQTSGGVTVRSAEVACTDDDRCRLGFALPQADAVVSIDSGVLDAAALETLRDSATLLPDGWTTVPPVDLAGGRTAAIRLLREAGFEATAGDRNRRGMTRTAPEAGTVVREGGEVEVTVGDQPD